MTRRPFASLVAIALWLVLATLWLALGLFQVFRFWASKPSASRWRKLARQMPRFPSPWRIAAWLPGRRRATATLQAEPRRLTSRQKDALVAIVADRDGLTCAECDCQLDPTLPHRHPQHPELHHLVPWSECKYEEWANHPLNLVLLCQGCHAPLGATRTTDRLEAKRLDLLDYYDYEEAA